MTTSIASAFTAGIEHNLLTITHRTDGQLRTLALIELETPVVVLLEDQVLRYRVKFGQDLLIPTPPGADSTDLLTQIATALATNKKRKQRQDALFKVAVVMGLSVMAIMSVLVFFNLHIPSSDWIRPYFDPSDYPLMHSQAVLQRAIEPGEAVGNVQPEAPGSSVKAAQDGWALPDSIRAGLPEKLQMAAERKLFTVEYSSGHARTLYVFADPACPNCQRLEPALEAAANAFNVVVFPVAVIGREQSIASITPVLCLPPEQRKAAWNELFDVAHGVMDMGKANAPGQGDSAAGPGDCAIAGKALGVNEVAYQTYRIPGTPWVIADDGRPVSQALLQHPVTLQTFMREAEVAHATFQ